MDALVQHEEQRTHSLLGARRGASAHLCRPSRKFGTRLSCAVMYDRTLRSRKPRAGEVVQSTASGQPLPKLSMFSYTPHVSAPISVVFDLFKRELSYKYGCFRSRFISSVRNQPCCDDDEPLCPMERTLDWTVRCCVVGFDRRRGLDCIVAFGRWGTESARLRALFWKPAYLIRLSCPLPVNKRTE